MQNPQIFATSTDPVLELLYGARINYTNSAEVKAIDSEVALKNWRGFCWGGLEGYCDAYTNRPNICVKTRGGTIHYEWFKSFMPYEPKMICMVRNLKCIVASMEKLFRDNLESHQIIQNHAEMQGTSTFKRAQIVLNSQPVGLALERLHDCIIKDTAKNFLYIKAEDFTETPKKSMHQIYEYLNLENHPHDFDNVEQYTVEDDSVFGIKNLHTIRPDIRPMKNDSEKILGRDICQWIDTNYAWYQNLFDYK
jgi:sulfotransferase